jgi:hypothetical protein
LRDGKIKPREEEEEAKVEKEKEKARFGGFIRERFEENG